MRHTVRALTFIASCVTMAIGFYDLYKNLPVFKDLIGNYISSIEDLIYLRITILMGYVLYFLSPVSFLF